MTWLYGNRYAQELGRFAIYLKDYNAGPIYGTNENSEPLKCPWYLVAVCQLRLHDHKLTLKQAWDWPVGDGGWLNAANAEAKGFKPDILTPELREAFAKIGVTSF